MKVNRAYLNYASLKVVLVVDPNRPTVNDASIVDMNQLITDVLTPFRDRPAFIFSGHLVCRSAFCTNIVNQGRIGGRGGGLGS